MKNCLIFILILFLLPVALYSSTPSVSPSSFFDSYGDLDWEWEKARLDNFAVFLSNNPAFVGHIFVWAGKRSCKGEAQARAMRAKTYLVDYRKVEWNRVIWHDMGYASELNTILEPMGRERPMLEFDSLVKKSEVEFLRNCMRGIPARKRTRDKSAATHNNRLQRTGISMSLINSLTPARLSPGRCSAGVRCSFA